MSNINGQKSSKLGRKGDPRMHRAVSARLANPEITLFEALKIGGFDYPTNDDSSVMDSEKVTLGQRKNQLSRRLRLAKKACNESPAENHQSEDRSAAAAAAAAAAATAAATRDINGKRQTPQDYHNVDDTAALSSSIQSSSMQQQKKQPRKPNKSSALALQMKHNEPDLSNFAGVDLDSTLDVNQESCSKRPRTAKDHPDFAPLFVAPPFRGGGGGNSGNSRASSSQTPTATNLDGGGGGHRRRKHSNAANSVNFHGGGSGIPGMNSLMNSPNFHAGTGSGSVASFTSHPTLFTQQIVNSFNLEQAQQPRASSVAISSLTNSAQSVGMTLEQLAMTLASNPAKLAELTGSDAQMKKQEIALALYETECRSMYSKCMLMSGIPPQLCQPGSSSYLQFALKAWQAEGRRLHDAMSRRGGSVVQQEPPLDADAEDVAEEDRATSSTSDGAAGDMDYAGHNGHDDCGSHDDHHEIGEQAEDQDDVSRNNDTKNNGNKAAIACSHPHLHRLDGECGHKAIIHHPKDGVAHIDFVIGDKVECYHGVDPMGSTFDSAWPSRYKCGDMNKECKHGGCAADASSGTRSSNDKNNHDKDKETANNNNDETENKSIMSTTVPKIIELSDINLHDPEWNFDVNGSIDGGVLGLFKLGGEKSEDGMSAI